MNFTILGLDIAKGSATQLGEYANLYNCKFTNYTNLHLFEQQVQSSTIRTVIIVDIDNDKKKKFNLCAKLKDQSNAIILFLSTDFDQDERVRWLSYGVTSYIKKPFRVEEIFRRAITLVNVNQKTMLCDQNFEVDLKQHIIKFQGKPIKITSKMFELIIYFMDNEGMIVTRDQLMSDVFDSSNYLTDRNIDTFIKQLRGQTDYKIIKTVRGVGYVYNS